MILSSSCLEHANTRDFSEDEFSSVVEVLLHKLIDLSFHLHKFIFSKRTFSILTDSFF